MFGVNNLKPKIKITPTAVECFVRNCNITLPRQRGHFQRKDMFKCPRHRIFVSPSTFEYENELENLLWSDEADQNLLRSIKTVKRESRMAHDNSEDAVTWNVFRFLEKEKLMANCFSDLIGRMAQEPEIVYWSYSQRERKIWTPLKTAREEFETKPEEGSEPDIIVATDRTLFIVEAKLTATNNTKPKMNSSIVQKKYTTGGNNWFSEVFSSNFETLAFSKRKYEPLRLWLLGSWVAQNLGLDFCLVNLVPSTKEKNIEESFKPLIREKRGRFFRRMAWEDFYQYIQKTKNADTQRKMMLNYFENKTIGYDRQGNLRKAFQTGDKRALLDCLCANHGFSLHT